MTPARAFESLGPGKFPNRAVRRAYTATLDGTCETAGDVSETGLWVGRTGPLFGLAKAGAVVSEDDQGFVDAEFYDDLDRLDRAWRGWVKHAEG